VAGVLLYLEENWRGRRAWTAYLHAERARGVELDWAKLPRPTVADDDNFFRAPGMAERLVRHGTGTRLAWTAPGIPPLALNRNAKTVIEILIQRQGDEPAPTNADLVLDYEPPLLRLARATAAPAQQADRDAIIPLIEMHDVPLLDCIQNLARQAGDNYLVDPSLGFGPHQPQPHVSFRWENVTAHAAILALLKNHNLRWESDPRSGIARIMRAEPNPLPISLGQGVSGQMEKKVRDIFGPLAYGSQGIFLFSRPIEDARPIRVVIRTGAPLDGRELSGLLNPQSAEPGGAVLSGLTLQPGPNDSYFVLAAAGSACSVDDYLNWSDHAQAAFAQLRSALRRPYALLPGDFRDPANLPTEDLLAFCTASQMLSQRAQCLLLRGQAEAARQELALLNGLRSVLNAPPTNRPTTVVAAVINAEIAGAYCSATADGLCLGAWQEPQLAVLQAQLETIELGPLAARAFACQRASTCTRLRQAASSSSGLMAWLSPSIAKGPLRWLNPQGLLVMVAPRGWTYQNLVQIAQLQEQSNDVLDQTGHYTLPHKVTQATREIDSAIARWSISTLLVPLAVPDFTRARQMLSWEQTRIHFMTLACALERYHLARGRYPDTLEALQPDYLRDLPLDVINGRPLHYCRVPDRGYQIYSVGWNEQDDSGTPGRPTDDPSTGDWTWRFPPD
jgi:hypothetical protein